MGPAPADLATPPPAPVDPPPPPAAGNVLVHILLVPVLFLTFQALFSIAFPPPPALAGFSADLGSVAGWPVRLELGGGTALALLYEAYYLVLDVPFAVESALGDLLDTQSSACRRG